MRIERYNNKKGPAVKIVGRQWEFDEAGIGDGMLKHYGNPDVMAFWSPSEGDISDVEKYIKQIDYVWAKNKTVSGVITAIQVMGKDVVPLLELLKAVGGGSGRVGITMKKIVKGIDIEPHIARRLIEVLAATMAMDKMGKLTPSGDEKISELIRKQA